MNTTKRSSLSSSQGNSNGDSSSGSEGVDYEKLHSSSKSKLSNFQKNNPDASKTQNDKGGNLSKSNKKPQVTGIKNNRRLINAKIKEKNND